MKKIAFVIDSLYNSGGMEKSMSVVAGVLTDLLDVTVITGLQKGHPLFYPLNNKVHYVDLRVNSNLTKGMPWDRSIRNDYFLKLKCFLCQNNYNYVVSLGGITQYFLYKIPDGSKKILWFKFEIDIFKVWCSGNRIKRWFESTFQKYRMIYHFRKFDKIVVLTKNDEKKWQKFTDKAINIYNPLTLSNPIISNCSHKQVIAVGRLAHVKGFDLLIDVWSNINQKYPDWKLVIYGEGDDRAILQEKIDRYHLQKVVHIPGRTKDIKSKYVESSIFVLSSREEGFGNVMTEAEACGLPIVAFDCPYGPREIVDDGENGFLIPLGNLTMLEEKIALLIEDEKLRKNMGIKSLETVKRFNVDKIRDKWISLLEEL